jgi:TP901 family phage tail tape measure protein
MGATARTISVIVDGSSADLDKALDSAIASLRKYEDTIGNVAKTALDLNKKIIDSNADLAASHKKVADSVGSYSSSIVASVGKQTDSIVSSSESINTAFDSQINSYKKVSAAANATADDVAVASDRQATSVKAATDSAVASSAKIGAAQDAAMGVVAAANIRGSNSTKSFSDKLTDSGKKTSELGSKLSALSVPILAIGAGSLYLGVKFQQAMTSLQTQAGYSEASVKKLYKEVERAAPELARTPHELAEGLYHVASVGIPASEAMNVIKQAAIGANIGGSNFDSTAKALANSLHALNLPASSARDQMATLNEIVGAGDLHMEELVGVLGTILPTAKSVGLGLRDAGVGMDVLTASGIPATKAATGLRQMFIKLDAPSKEVKERMEAIGLTQSSLAEDLTKPNGLNVMLQDLKKHLDSSNLSAIEQKNLLIAIGGGARSGAGGLLPLYQNLKKVEEGYKRIPDNLQSVKKMEEGERKWESSSQSLLDHSKAALEGIGVTIGDVEMQALPIFNKFIQDIDSLAKGFDSLPGPVKDSMIAVLAFGAVIGPVLKITGNLLKAGGAVTGLFSHGKSSIVSSAASTVEDKTVGGISGVRGFAAPGSIANPIVVTMESGKYSGLGGQAAAEGESSAADAETAAAEERSAGGVILPAGVKSVAADVAPEAESIGERALPAVAAAAPEAVEGAGLGIGALAAPEVAIPAAAAAIGIPMLLKIPAVKNTVTSALKDIENAFKPLEPTFKQLESTAGVFLNDLSTDAGKAGKAFQEFGQAAEPVAKTVVHVIDEIIIKSGFLKDDVDNALHGLETIVDGALHIVIGLFDVSESILTGNWSKAWEGVKEVGKGALDAVVGLVEYASAPFVAAWEAFGAPLVHIITSEFDKVEKAVEGFIAGFLHDGEELGKHIIEGLVKGVEDAPGDVGKAIGHVAKGALDTVGEVLGIGSPSKEMQILGEFTIQGFVNGLHNSKLAESVSKIFTESLKTAQSSVKDGIESINKELNVEIKSLGSSSVVSTKKVGAKGHAGGGLIQLGKQGERGLDSIPLNAGGVPILAAPGEQIAVLNSHQQDFLNHRLADVGGIPGMFNKINTPHHMASGGFVPQPGTNFSYGYEPKIVADLKKLSAEIKKTIYGISGYRSPSHSVAVGGFSNDPHTEGKAADIGAGAPTLASMLSVSESQLRAVGLYRPFYPPDSAEANHVQLIGVPFGNSSGLPGGTGSGTGSLSSVIEKLSSPGINGSGAMKNIAQAALKKVIEAANNKLSSSSFSGISGGGSNSQNESLGRKMMEADGISASQWPYLQKLWQRESGWNQFAKNPSSPAYGIPQDDSGEHPYGTNPKEQIEWGLNYIKGRYGTPSAAWAHELSAGWYNQGGIVNAARGYNHYIPNSHSTQKVNKGKVNTPKVKAGQKAKDLQSLVHGIGKIPDTENVGRITAFEPTQKKLEALRSLLSKIVGEPNDTFLLPQNITELAPTLAPNESFSAFTPIAHALFTNQNAITANGESSNLSYQKELINYFGELPENHLLTSSDVALLKGAGVSAFSSGLVKPYASVYPPVENTISQQVQSSEELLKVEEDEVKKWHKAYREYTKRQAQVLKHAKAEYKRYENIKAQIQKLTTGSLKEKVHNAENKTYQQQLKSDAETSERAIEENLIGEQGLMSRDQDRNLINQYKNEKLQIASYIKSLDKPLSGTGAAKVALRKNDLNLELTPIEESLSVLTGSKTSIGKGGKYGEYERYRNTLESGITKMNGEVFSLKSSTIPGFAIELATQRSEDENAHIKPAPSLVGAETNTALETVQKEEIEQLGKSLILSQEQFSTIKNFQASIPHFEKGGPVLNDGPIFAHSGEYVVPKGGALTSTSSPNVSLNVQHHFHGAVGALIDLVDSRIAHPDNVKIISQQVSRRTGNIPGYR